MSPPSYIYPPPTIPAPLPPSPILDPSRSHNPVNIDRHMSPDEVVSRILEADPQTANYQNIKPATTHGFDRVRKKTIEHLDKPLAVVCWKLVQSRNGPGLCNPKAIEPIVALLRAFVRTEGAKNGEQPIRDFWHKLDNWLAARRGDAGEDWAGGKKANFRPHSFVDRIIAADNSMHARPALAIAADNRLVYCCKYAPFERSASSAYPASPSSSVRSSSSSAGLSGSWASGSGSTSALNAAPAHHNSNLYSDSLPPQTRPRANAKQTLPFILNQER
ncbi:hypothetical protein B0H16DRAFT_1688606 [Mycena metata]|uniref:Uncharacterized protein n=1 Tax=Mycena metata TaxID=1033252 RepID=A0AAD7JB05_9AGAR|nr:hypothetical protein B0H16DRAFT_1688606 [Mycena metata]